MDELHEELDEGGVSRRDALKKMGVTAAGFWAVPIISSFRSPAFAQVTSPQCLCSPANPCHGLDDCGGVGAPCNCLPTVDGECFCHAATGCAGLTPCTSQGDCSALPGYVCATSCCAGGAFCHPPCGVATGARVPGEAWSTA
jgi:hypothetical protein